MMINLPRDKKIILFDGVCNLCDATVQRIIENDKKDIFRFAAIQSEVGQQIIKYIDVDTAKTDSIILYEPGHSYYYKAEAAMKIASEMGSWYSIISWFGFLPGWLSNAVYDFVARNRYKWYGKKNECMMPTPELMAKFL